jgi:two-component system phosphate regulon response regulator PhoB
MSARVEQEILIVEDEQSVRDLLAFVLRRAGYAVRKAHDATSCLARMTEHRPHLALVDWLLPDGSGLELARALKTCGERRRIAVIMVSARSEEADRVTALDAGADDYVTKPFSTRELLARIESLLRRFAPAGAAFEPLELHGLTLDPTAYRVISNGREVSLSPSDCRILSFLMVNAERAYSRGQLLESIWGHDAQISPRTVDVHVRRLRVALKQVHCAHLLQTVPRVGYRFSAR